MDSLISRKSIIPKFIVGLMLLVFISGATGWMVNAEDGGGDGFVVLSKTQIPSSRFDEQQRLRVIVQLNVPGQTTQAELMTPAIHYTQNELMSAMKAYNIRLIHEYDYIPFMAMEVDRAAFEGLLKSPLVVGIEEDILMKPLLAESVPLINADDVWAAGYTGTGQVVAVLDTGVDKNHPALAGKVVSEACYSTTSTTSIPPSTSLCPGGVSESIEPGSALPYASNCPPGECDHGTHVAGIVAAYSATVNGVAKDADLIAIQVFSRIDNYNIGSWSSDQIKGLERVYELRSTYNIAAVNLSLGGGLYANECDQVNSAYKSKVDLLRTVGIVTIAAAGNDYDKLPDPYDALSSPACISTVVSVGATTKDDKIAIFSNRSNMLDLLAPGVSIQSTIPNNQTAYYNGTSMAAPHVAGAWALIRSIQPDIQIDDLLNSFKDSGVLISDSRDDNIIVKPRIDVFATLELLNKVTLTPSFHPPIIMDVSWLDLYNNENGYTIERRIVGDLNWIEIGSTAPDIESITDTTGLVCEENYEYKVTPIDITGNLTPAEATSLLCAPNSVSKISGTQERIVLSWNDLSAQETSYQVERYDTKKKEWNTLASLVSNTTSYSDIGLICSTSYSYQVKAIQTVNNITAYNVSPEIELSTNPCGPPPTPENLNGRPLSLYSIHLTWDDVLDDETGYDIERYNEVTSSWNNIETLLEDTIVWDDTNLDAYQNYQYRIIAFNSSGRSDPSEPVNVSTDLVQVFLPLLTK